MSQFVKTKIELCQRVAVTRPTLNDMLASPGAPQKTKKGWSVEKVAAWVKAKSQTESNLAKRDDGIRELKRQEIELRLHRQRKENELFEGRLIPKETCTAVYRFTVEKAKQHLLSISQKAVARFGHMGPDVEKWVAEEHLEFLRIMQREFDDPKP